MDGEINGFRHADGRRIRAFRIEDIGRLADARVAGFDSFGGARGADTRALRAERRNKGGAAYDLLRHIGLMRRAKRRPPAPSGLIPTFVSHAGQAREQAPQSEGRRQHIEYI